MKNSIRTALIVFFLAFLSRGAHSSPERLDVSGARWRNLPAWQRFRPVSHQLFANSALLPAIDIYDPSRPKKMFTTLSRRYEDYSRDVAARNTASSEVMDETVENMPAGPASHTLKER